MCQMAMVQDQESDLGEDPGVDLVVVLEGVPVVVLGVAPQVFKYPNREHGVSEEMQGVLIEEEGYQPFNGVTQLNLLKLSPANLQGVRV